jgi:hypothetical protein
MCSNHALRPHSFKHAAERVRLHTLGQYTTHPLHAQARQHGSMQGSPVSLTHGLHFAKHALHLNTQLAEQHIKRILQATRSAHVTIMSFVTDFEQNRTAACLCKAGNPDDVHSFCWRLATQRNARGVFLGVSAISVLSHSVEPCAEW